MIPDGAVQGVQLLQTPSYVQISGQWDGTRVNIPAGDAGGELDPHGATGEGNPVGGNVTTHLATGNNVFYEEWMMFIGANQFCFRICTANLNGVGVDKQCEHIYDVMGCQWVMALDPNTFYSNQFISCKADVAAAPGVYGGYTWYQGMEPTPSTPAYIPASSQCTTYATISSELKSSEGRTQETVG